MTSPSTLSARILRALRVRQQAGGLEVRAEALRFVWQERGGWNFASVALPPGVVRDGTVEDAAQFRDALLALKRQIVSRSSASVHAIVSLNSSRIYTQAFSLPALEGAALEEAANLNLQMSSPIEFSGTYAGWQVIANDPKSLKIEMLAGFIDRGVVDSFLTPMREAGFVVGAVEPYALSFTRALKTVAAGFDPASPSLAAIVDDAGVALMVIRGGELAFQYMVPWSVIQADGKEIPWETFRAAFLEHARKVLSFAAAHWTGTIRTAFVFGGSLDEAVRAIIGELGLTPRPIVPASGEVGVEWFAALGAGLRGLVSLREDAGMSLLGVSAREEYYREETIRFLHFWRIMVPVSLFILLGVSWGAAMMVRNAREDAEALSRRAARQESAEVAAFAPQVKAFNSLTAAATGVTDSARPKVPELARVKEFFTAHQASFESFSIDAAGNVSLHARIPSEDALLALADALRRQSEFQNVNLPLQDIATGSGGVSFFITFTIAASKAP